MQKYILIGDSGHSKVIQESIELCGDCVIAKLDDKYDFSFQVGTMIKGPISMLNEILKENIQVIIAIGNNRIRQRIVERLRLKDNQYGKVIHPSAMISKSAIISSGTVIMPGAVINTDTLIGKQTIINSNAIIEHDCKINNFVHISPGVSITGNVTIDEGTHIGAGVTIIPGLSIGKWSTIGAGGVVINSISNNVTAVGVPATVVKKEGL